MGYTASEFIGTFWTTFDGDYYVSTIGRDTYNGSPKQPFLTVAKAFEVAVDGDKIVVGPDEYVLYGQDENNPSGAELPCRVAAPGHIFLESAGSELRLDKILLNDGDRVLAWNQAGPAENGIYIYSGGSLQRDPNFNSGENIIPGKLIPILEGETNGKVAFQLTTTDPINIGSTLLTFEKIIADTEWSKISGEITTNTDLQDELDLKANATDLTGAISDINDIKGGAPTEGDNLNKLYNLIQGKVGVSASANDITDRDSQKANLKDQQNIYVADASIDSTVESGWAVYKYIDTSDSFIKIAEQESIDLVLSARAIIAGYDNVLFVQESGDDTTAKFGELAFPYATPHIASAAARADFDLNGNRNLVYVLKGTYNDHSVIENHVDFEAQDGVVIYTTGAGESVINDISEVMDDISVYGKGTYIHQYNNPVNDSMGINIREASNFSVEAKTVDGIQIWQHHEVKFDLSNCNYLLTGVYSSINKVINLKNCTFQNGVRSNSYNGANTELNFTNCEFIVPEHPIDHLSNTSLDINDYEGNFLFRIQPNSSNHDPIDTDSLASSDEVISLLNSDYTTNNFAAPICIGFMYSQNTIYNIGNFKCNHLNSIVRIKRDKCIGLFLGQKKDSNSGGVPSVTFSNVRIFDESGGTDTVALVTGWGVSATVQPALMLQGITHNCTTESKLLDSSLNPWIKTFQEIGEGAGVTSTNDFLDLNDQVSQDLSGYTWALESSSVRSTIHCILADGSVIITTLPDLAAFDHANEIIIEGDTIWIAYKYDSDKIAISRVVRLENVRVYEKQNTITYDIANDTDITANGASLHAVHGMAMGDDYLFFTTRETPMKLGRVHKHNFADISIIEFPNDGNYKGGDICLYHQGYLYINTADFSYSDTLKIVKVSENDLSNHSLIIDDGTPTVPGPFSIYKDTLITTASKWETNIILSAWTLEGKLIKTTAIDLGAISNGQAHGGVIHNGFYYITTAFSNQILKINADDFSLVQQVGIPHDATDDMVIGKDGFIYIGTENYDYDGGLISSPFLYKIDLADLSVQTTIATLTDSCYAIASSHTIKTNKTSGSFSLTDTHININAKNSDYTLTASDNGDIIECSGIMTVYVPASGITSGWSVQIVNRGMGLVTLNSNGLVINSKGSTDPLLESQWGGCTLYYDGIDFVAIGDVT